MSPKQNLAKMAQQSILVTQIGSDGPSPSQYTAQSPSLARYRMTSTIVDYGDYTTNINNPAGIQPQGFIYVQYHINNQWTSRTLYVTQTGAQIKTLIEA